MARRPAWFPRSWGRAGLCVCHGGTAVAQGPGRAPQGAGVLGPLGRLGALTVTLPWGSLAVTSLQGRGRGELPPSCPSAPPVTALLSGFPETHRLPVSSASRQRGALPSPAGAPGLGSAGHGWAGRALSGLPAIGPGPHSHPLCGGQEATPRGGHWSGWEEGREHPHTIPGLPEAQRGQVTCPSHTACSWAGRSISPTPSPRWLQKGRRGPPQQAGGGAFINPESCELGWINIYRAFPALPTAVQG